MSSPLGPSKEYMDRLTPLLEEHLPVSDVCDLVKSYLKLDRHQVRSFETAYLNMYKDLNFGEGLENRRKKIVSYLKQNPGKFKMRAGKKDQIVIPDTVFTDPFADRVIALLTWRDVSPGTYEMIQYLRPLVSDIREACPSWTQTFPPDLSRSDYSELNRFRNYIENYPAQRDIDLVQNDLQLMDQMESTSPDRPHFDDEKNHNT